nr:vWA domain-containing protein [uncultured Acetatifactor sp.]
MRQRKVLTGLLTAFALLLMSLAGSITAFAVDTPNANRMNVVFVMDESGSMSKTDAESLRYDAMDLFLGLATESGNYMGAVAFDDDIILKRDIAGIEGLNDKTALSRDVRSVSSRGDTNIGKAIEAATQMLQESGNPALPSAIILLSDGNTDLGGNDARLQESYASRDNAIEAARANGYKIYSVCLNTNGDADPAELQEISAATGGTSVEVKSADDLKEVFSQFYNIIYSTETIVLGDIVIPDNGETEIPFDIPRIGVEEANIIISTLNSNTSYMLYQPSGIAYTESELDAMKITAKTFSVLKIQNPEAGAWRLVVKGVPGDSIKIEMIYNSDLDIVQNFNSGNPVFADADVLIGAQISNMGNLITDSAIYQEYPMHVVLTEVGSGTVNDYEMTAGSQQAEYTFHLPQGAEYDVYTYCSIDNLTVTSETARLSAGRPLPVASEDPIEITKTLPFTKAEYLFDLSSVFSDSEDATLSYSITQSEFDSSVVSVEGENLNIKVKEIGKGGELFVTATNSGGGSIEVQVILKTVNLLPLLLAILAAVVVLVLLIVLLGAKKKGNVPINGRIQIIPYNEDGVIGNPNTFEGGRGKMMIGHCLTIRENVGIDIRNTYFIHGEKDSYIYLVSKNGYYTDVNPDVKNKKIRLDSEMEVDVSSDIDFIKGIRVMYISDEMNY